jgi:hypothetical protein
VIILPTLRPETAAKRSIRVIVNSSTQAAITAVLHSRTTADPVFLHRPTNLDSLTPDSSEDYLSVFAIPLLPYASRVPSIRWFPDRPQAFRPSFSAIIPASNGRFLFFPERIPVPEKDRMSGWVRGLSQLQMVNLSTPIFPVTSIYRSPKSSLLLRMWSPKVLI